MENNVACIIISNYPSKLAFSVRFTEFFGVFRNESALAPREVKNYLALDSKNRSKGDSKVNRLFSLDTDDPNGRQRQH